MACTFHMPLSQNDTSPDIQYLAHMYNTNSDMTHKLAGHPESGMQTV